LLTACVLIGRPLTAVQLFDAQELYQQIDRRPAANGESRGERNGDEFADLFMI
jgi:hypothetical protein